MNKKRAVGIIVLIASTLGVVATCWQDTTEGCPTSANFNGATCNLLHDDTIPWVTAITDPTESGEDSTVSDNTKHCEYQCTDGNTYWAYTGSNITGNECTGGGSGTGGGGGGQ